MVLEFSNEQTEVLPFDPETLAVQVIERVLDDEGCPYEAEASLTLVDNEEIHRMNKEFRQIDRATDVLSFPMVQYDQPACFEKLGDMEDAFDPESGRLLLGDIVISVQRAKEQAKEYGHSIRREIAFLIAHSTLHLLGYDHMVKEEAEIMEAKQEKALQELGITRDAD
ncbi:MAG: rRNA maturation RNase YbeY [Eubacterium sp.]|nr:rRNA maturation RNase YbeY [Eubacterium sp.]